MKRMRKKNHGGKRKGAGRKPGIKSVVIGFRIDRDQSINFKRDVKELLRSKYRKAV